jgi:hypothetical protein
LASPRDRSRNHVPDFTSHLTVPGRQRSLRRSAP